MNPQLTEYRNLQKSKQWKDRNPVLLNKHLKIIYYNGGYYKRTDPRNGNGMNQPSTSSSQNEDQHDPESYDSHIYQYFIENVIKNPIIQDEERNQQKEEDSPKIPHCSMKGGNFDLVLEYKGDFNEFTCTDIIIRGSPYTTSNLKSALCWISKKKPNVEQTAIYNDYKLNKNIESTLKHPSFIEIHEETMEGSIKFEKEWPIGKYIHLKFLEGQAKNIDIEQIAIIGYPGSSYKVRNVTIPESMKKRLYVPFKPQITIFKNPTVFLASTTLKETLYYAKKIANEYIDKTNTKLIHVVYSHLSNPSTMKQHIGLLARFGVEHKCCIIIYTDPKTERLIKYIMPIKNTKQEFQLTEILDFLKKFDNKNLNPTIRKESVPISLKNLSYEPLVYDTFENSLMNRNQDSLILFYSSKFSNLFNFNYEHTFRLLSLFLQHEEYPIKFYTYDLDKNDSLHYLHFPGLYYVVSNTTSMSEFLRIVPHDGIPLLEQFEGLVQVVLEQTKNENIRSFLKNYLENPDLLPSGWNKCNFSSTSITTPNMIESQIIQRSEETVSSILQSNKVQSKTDLQLESLRDMLLEPYVYFKHQDIDIGRAVIIHSPFDIIFDKILPTLVDHIFMNSISKPNPFEVLKLMKQMHNKSGYPTFVLQLDETNDVRPATFIAVVHIENDTLLLSFENKTDLPSRFFMDMCSSIIINLNDLTY
mmetsp:Transcript_2408/g.3501  ORF Transcript_2408/g.3501 Transcript_2408/m.3501 type:complete len:699 (-) Transcript_2408:1928-4024(-)